MVGTVIANLSMVVYHRLMSQSLGQDYGRLITLMALTNVLGAVTMGVNTALVKDFSRDAEKIGPGAVKGRLKLIALPGLAWLAATAVLLLLLAPAAMAYLHLPKFSELAILALLFTLGIGLLALRAAVQGLHHFGSLSTSLVAESAGRAAFGWPMAMAWGVGGGLISMIAGQAIGILLLVPGLIGLGRSLAPAKPILAVKGQRGRWSEALADTATLTLFSLLLYLDLFVAKHYYSDAQVADYGRAALVSKSFLHLASAFNMVLLPAVAAALVGGRSTRALLLKFIAAVLVIDLIGLGVVWGATDFCIRLLCGPDPNYLSLAPLVRVFSVGTIVQALFQLTLFYLIAIRSRATLWLMLALTPVYYLVLAASHESPFDIVRGLALCAGLGLVVALGLVLRSETRELA